MESGKVLYKYERERAIHSSPSASLVYEHGNYVGVSIHVGSIGVIPIHNVVYVNICIHMYRERIYSRYDQHIYFPVKALIKPQYFV